MDPRTILYSMSTIASDAAPVGPPIGASELAFHQDEWRQLEFFPATRAPEIQNKLRELKAFSEANRTASGWLDIFARDIPNAPVIAGANAVTSLSSALSCPITDAPDVFTGATRARGRVQSGFSIPLRAGAWLYGLRDQSGISVLGAYLGGGDDVALTNAYMTLNRSFKLILVDWRLNMLLLGVNANQSIDVWGP